MTKKYYSFFLSRFSPRFGLSVDILPPSPLPYDLYFLGGSHFICVGVCCVGVCCMCVCAIPISFSAPFTMRLYAHFTVLFCIFIVYSYDRALFGWIVCLSYLRWLELPAHKVRCIHAHTPTRYLRTKLLLLLLLHFFIVLRTNGRAFLCSAYACINGRGSEKQRARMNEWKK